MAHIMKSTRRSFMSGIGALGAALLSPRKLFAAGGAAKDADAKLSGLGASGNVYEELGVTTVINGQGTMTILGGSLMRPEVEAAMALASQHFCSIPELEVAAGKRIAEMLKLPADYTGLVTSGAAAAMQSGLAGIRTRGNSYRRQRAIYSAASRSDGNEVGSNHPEIASQWFRPSASLDGREAD